MKGLVGRFSQTGSAVFWENLLSKDGKTDGFGYASILGDGAFDVGIGSKLSVQIEG